MNWTPTDIALGRLVAQGLLDPLPDAVEAVHRLSAVQGQDLAGALASIALRTRGRRLTDVVDAFNSGDLVRTWPMRGTLHVARRTDVAWMLSLTGPRMRAADTRRRAQLGITDEVYARARDWAVARLTDAGTLTRAELVAGWDGLGLLGVQGRAYHLIYQLGYEGLVGQGPVQVPAPGRVSPEQRFILLDPGESAGPPDEDAALARWVHDYFAGHGPATVADFVRWTGLTAAQTRRGLAASTGLDSARDGRTQWWFAQDLPDRMATHRGTELPMLLLPGFDELILGYKDRTACVDPDREVDICPGRNGMFRPTVVVDGRVVATWAAPPGRRVPQPAWFHAASGDLAAAFERAAGQFPGWPGVDAAPGVPG